MERTGGPYSVMLIWKSTSIMLISLIDDYKLKVLVGLWGVNKFHIF